jgi:hypothetical protein
MSSAVPARGRRQRGRSRPPCRWRSRGWCPSGQGRGGWPRERTLAGVPRPTPSGGGAGGFDQPGDSVLVGPKGSGSTVRFKSRRAPGPPCTTSASSIPGCRAASRSRKAKSVAGDVEGRQLSAYTYGCAREAVLLELGARPDQAAGRPADHVRDGSRGGLGEQLDESPSATTLTAAPGVHVRAPAPDRLRHPTPRLRPPSITAKRERRRFIVTSNTSMEWRLCGPWQCGASPTVAMNRPCPAFSRANRRRARLRSCRRSTPRRGRRGRP